MSAPYILDVDTGTDDALALILAARHPDIDLRAVTCVAGNTSIENVVRNTGAVLQAIGAPGMPVAGGAERPLLEPHRDADHVHGVNGLAGIDLPASLVPPARVHAVELLRQQLTSSEQPITLVALGPLTNVALLLRMYPAAAARIGRIVLMGGSASVGNATPVAEFNVWHDPEAAAVVFGTSVPLTMYGLDVFTGLQLTDDQVANMAGAEDPGANLVHRILTGRPTLVDEGYGLGDAGAVCAAVDPAGMETERARVAVECGGVLARGQTIVDRRARPGEADLRGARFGEYAEVGLAIDVDRYRELFLRHACQVESGVHGRRDARAQVRAG
ncbi:nucleoside hydrolase [Ruania alba]|uniref:Pyrimidine-specific ribonucleoside hydrolase n=1 Tax=Ruania alba TaxID=648782 RepID=A0A1H5CQ63_9MICO|nr:nucleoside hydrolase [Ruania alba]SED68842.1 pyrimidine-specific ribonucleoside hydrolase [Ruania alba]